jgi:hypothetical protein
VISCLIVFSAKVERAEAQEAAAEAVVAREALAQEIDR